MTDHHRGLDPDELPVLAALHSTPSRRYLSDEPIPDDILWEILDAAIRGPSGGNTQHWGWLVVTDPEIKRRIAVFFREGWDTYYGPYRDEILGAAPSVTGLSPAGYRAVEHLVEHVHEAPVWIIPFLRHSAGVDNPRLGASIYGAVQQLQLAARAYGIGSTLTTFHTTHEDEVRALLGLPDDALTMALLPLGYPVRGRWSQPPRQPVDEVTHWNRWGETRQRPARDAGDRSTNAS